MGNKVSPLGLNGLIIILCKNMNLLFSMATPASLSAELSLSMHKSIVSANSVRFATFPSMSHRRINNLIAASVGILEEVLTMSFLGGNGLIHQQLDMKLE